MKKILLILSLYVFICNSLSAQTYTPFPENIAVWDIYEQPGPDGPFFPELYHRYTMTGDTVINGISYNKVYYSTYSKQYNVPIKVVKQGYCFAIRQDIPNKKVYRTLVVNNTTIDTLLYDFDLNVGDTVPETYTTSHVIAPQTVEAIDSIIFHGRQYKRLKLKYAIGFGAALIEGVGSPNGLIEPHFGFFEAGPVLKDFCNSDHSDCSVPLALKIEEVDHSDLLMNAYPNPFSDETTLNFTTEQPMRKAVLYNILGKEIQIFNCTSKQLVIQKGELKNGIYFLKITNGDDVMTKRIIVQ
jgi:hypothetical protein